MANETGAPANCWGICRLDGQQSPTLGGLQVSDIGAPHRPQQVLWGKASRRGGYFPSDFGKVCAGGDGGGGQGGLRDGVDMWWPVGGY